MPKTILARHFYIYFIIYKELAGLPWVKNTKQHKPFLNLTVEHGEQRIPELIGIANKAGVTVNAVSLHKPSLEDVFLHFTGKTIREQEAEGNEHLRNRMRR